ncbi:MAG: GNAT family N-acetyltransferase [Alphaproteobacteria bacterium]|nr:GNAT family N-acetyltransferase [Alphaproteobacteria bacterium]
MNKVPASCNIVTDYHEQITDWVCFGLGMDKAWLDNHYTIGFVYQGRLIGGLIYHNIRFGRDVWWTLYTTDKHWCNRRILKFMFSVAFDYFKCKRITVMTTKSNLKCQKLAKDLGFRQEGNLLGYADNGEDIIIMGIQREQSKF